MTQEAKYYTPSIEEFHVGFEYEYSEYGRKIWINETADADDVLLAFSTYEEHNEEFANTYRVKLLDKEDIESLGFDGYEPPREYNHSWKYKGSKEPKLYVWFNNPIPVVRVYGNFPQTLFQGEIKNKSELKRLIAQLGI